jgi:hypothetical protein
VRGRVRILGECLVDVSVIDTHSKLATSLGDDGKFAQPLRVLDLMDEVGMEQLVNLLMDEVLLLHGLFPRLFLHRPHVSVDLQMVLHHHPRTPGMLDGCQAITSTLAQSKAMA